MKEKIRTAAKQSLEADIAYSFLFKCIGSSVGLGGPNFNKRLGNCPIFSFTIIDGSSEVKGMR